MHIGYGKHLIRENVNFSERGDVDIAQLTGLCATTEIKTIFNRVAFSMTTVRAS